MVFSSHVFLFYFLPVFLLIYFSLVRLRVNLSWINLFVTISSYFFYGWFEPWFVILMFVSTIVDYGCGKAIAWPRRFIERGKINPKEWLGELRSVNFMFPLFVLFGHLITNVSDRARAEKLLRNSALTTSIVVNLGLLGFFKYYMFFMEGINRLAQMLGAESALFDIMSVTLPIGISFYTFQSMSYTIDVWRGTASPVKDMRTFSCFVALFPQLIAGPIIRYNTIATQLAHRTHSVDMFTRGAAIFITGLAKKVFLADAVGQIADTVFGADGPDMLSAWWGVLAYSFQIYFDFCAYSDMAVGLGRMMGFEFIKNFNAPYRSDSISSFWNRWHISLSTWIRDYLYISLGGNRRGKSRTYLNLALTMTLCGLWHGAQMTFIAWGMYHGAMLLWERSMGRRPLYHRFPLIPRIILTNIIVLFGWVLFRAPTLNQAMLYWGSMVGAVEPAQSASLLQALIFTRQHLVEMIACGFLVWQPIQAHEWVKHLSPAKYVVLGLLFVFSILQMFASTFSPFLYFQF
ncbi:MAG: MBOAT family O-acyltransferase [Chitinispirillaceae bacterium]